MAVLLMGLLACLLAHPALVVDGATATVTIAGSASPLVALAKAELERYGAQTTFGASDSELRLLLLDLSEVEDDAAAIQLYRCSGTHGTNLQPQEHVVHRCSESDNSDSAHHFLLVRLVQNSLNSLCELASIKSSHAIICTDELNPVCQDEPQTTLGERFHRVVFRTGGWTLGPLALDSWTNGGIAPGDGGNSSTIPLVGDR
eukprot:COSAG06_NODE_43_length_29826_cov_32.009621_16_plen_202_part_00